MPVSSRLRWCSLVVIPRLSGLDLLRRSETIAAASEASDVVAEPVTSVLSAHVHGVGISPSEGAVLVATPEGSFKLLDGQVERFGTSHRLGAFQRGRPGSASRERHPRPGCRPAEAGWPQIARRHTLVRRAVAWRSGQLSHRGCCRGRRCREPGAAGDHVDRKRWTASSAAVEPSTVVAAPSDGPSLIPNVQGPCVSRVASSSCRWTVAAPSMLRSS